MEYCLKTRSEEMDVMHNEEEVRIEVFEQLMDNCSAAFSGLTGEDSSVQFFIKVEGEVFGAPEKRELC